MNTVKLPQLYQLLTAKDVIVCTYFDIFKHLNYISMYYETLLHNYIHITFLNTTRVPTPASERFKLRATIKLIPIQ